jgi:hypothetical protein
VSQLKKSKSAVGDVDTSYLGQFAVSFSNAGADHYAVGVTLNYQLNANVAGEDADSTLLFDYYNIGDTFVDSDYLNANLLSLATAAKSGSAGLYSFNLAANASQTLSGDVVINGNLHGTTVPLPAAVWLFGCLARVCWACLGWRGAGRFRDFRLFLRTIL